MDNEKENAPTAMEALKKLKNQQISTGLHLEERKAVRAKKFPEEVETLELLYKIFGKAVFVPTKIWGPPDAEGNFGAKGAPLWKGWPKLTYEATLAEDYQELLCERLTSNSNKLAGNIAVLLGEPSGNLVSIDFDDRKCIEPFLQKNPTLRYTTYVETYRGRHIFFRLIGDYAKAVCQISVNGESIGEFRGGKGLSTICGHHPKSTFNNPIEYRPSLDEIPNDPEAVPVITWRYEDIIWPDGWTVDDSERAAKKVRKSHKKYSLDGKPGSIDLDALNEAIESDVEMLCAELFSEGRMVGNEFRLADKTGAAPKAQGSLTVTTTGQYAGRWTDWVTGDNGSFIDLVKSACNVDFKGAVFKIEEVLGQKFRVPEEKKKTKAKHHLPTRSQNGSRDAELKRVCGWLSVKVV